MPVGSVLAFWGVAVLLIAVPGPDWAFALRAGLRRQVVPAASGIVLGYLVMTAVVAGGVGVLITSTPAALTVLTVTGGLYLVRLGVTILRHPAAPSDSPGAPPGSRGGTVLQGMAVSGLNPKGLLIFVALLPQFTDPHASWPVPVQMATLGLVFTATCAVVYLCVGAAARSLRHAGSSASRLISRVCGASMVVIGAALIVERMAA